MKDNEIKLTHVRGAYPYLLESRLNTFGDGDPKEEYSMLIIFRKDAPYVSTLRKAIANAARGKWTKKPAGFRDPLRDGDAEREGQPEFEGMYFMNLKSKFQPLVIGPKLQPLLSVDEYKSGDYFNVIVAPYVYDRSGNKGVAFNLGDVQWLKKGELVGQSTAARAAANFEAWGDDDEPEDDLDDLMGEKSEADAW